MTWEEVVVTVLLLGFGPARHAERIWVAAQCRRVARRARLEERRRAAVEAVMERIRQDLEREKKLASLKGGYQCMCDHPYIMHTGDLHGCSMRYYPSGDRCWCDGFELHWSHPESDYIPRRRF